VTIWNSEPRTRCFVVSAARDSVPIAVTPIASKDCRSRTIDSAGVVGWVRNGSSGVRVCAPAEYVSVTPARVTVAE
jgi:hypothetical protein